MQSILNHLRRFKVFAVIGDQITDPIKFRRLNGWLVVIWFAMFFVATASGLIYLLIFTNLLSLYANLATHLGVWASSRAEVAASDVEVEANHAKVRANEVDVEQK